MKGRCPSVEEMTTKVVGMVTLVVGVTPLDEGRFSSMEEMTTLVVGMVTLVVDMTPIVYLCVQIGYMPNPLWHRGQFAT